MPNSIPWLPSSGQYGDPQNQSYEGEQPVSEPTEPGVAAGALPGFVVAELEGTVTHGLTGAHTLAVNETAIFTGATTATATLPAPQAGADCMVVNAGSGTITVTPASGSLYSLANATGNQTLAAAASGRFRSDGTNWYRVN